MVRDVDTPSLARCCIVCDGTLIMCIIGVPVADEPLDDATALLPVIWSRLSPALTASSMVSTLLRHRSVV